VTRDELVTLLGSWHDFYPLPPTWTGELQRRATKPGPAPFQKVTCATCEGRGKLRGGWVCKDCKGRGRYWIDGYTSGIVDDTESPWSQLLAGVVDCWKCGGWGRLGAHAETRPDRDARLCPECEGTGKQPAPLAPRTSEQRGKQGDRTLDALESQHTRRDALRAYRVLAAALDELRARAPGVAFLIAVVYVLELQQPSRVTEDTIELGLRFLHARLAQVKPPKLVTQQTANREAAMIAARGRGADPRAQRIRDDEIRRRHDAGETVTALAVAFSLNKSQVSRIVNRP
jgi:hypothetical protein